MTKDRFNEARLVQAIEGMYQPEPRSKETTLTLKVDDWLWIEHSLAVTFRETDFDLADAAQVKKIIGAVQEIIFRVTGITGYQHGE